MTRRPLKNGLRKIRRFFEKAPESSVVHANKKGHGFHLLRPPQQDRDIRRTDKRLIYGFSAGAFGMALIVLAMGLTTTPEFTILTGSMLTLCGLIGWDIASRRGWEAAVSDKIERLSSHHDRLVREVARNRNDVAGLKEGLGKMALDVSAQGRFLPQSASIEARMIDTIVTQLGAIGDRPRPAIDAKGNADILELEMTPPPIAPPPRSALDAELDADFSGNGDVDMSAILRHAVHQNAIEMFMQPIVGLPQRKPKLYEIFARIRTGDGTCLPAGRYRMAAEQDNLVPAIDNLLLLRCLDMLSGERKKDAGLPFMINVTTASLHDTAFMNDLIAFLTRSRAMASRLVFELAQDDLDGANDKTVSVLGGLSKLGCRFSMDRVRSRVIDVGRLKGMNIRFIKLDAAWLLREGSDHKGFSRIARMKKQLDASGIDLIVERIETEAALRELLDYNIDYGQGWLFGKPDHHAAWNGGRIVA